MVAVATGRPTTAADLGRYQQNGHADTVASVRSLHGHVLEDLRGALMEPQYVAAVIGPLSTALLAAGGIAIRTVYTRRRGTSARDREMQSARQTVEFIAHYLSALNSLENDEPWLVEQKARAAADLEQAYQRMQRASREQTATVDRIDWAAVVRRVLLVPTHRPAARLVRLLYYLVLAYAIFSSTIYLLLPFGSEEMRAFGLTATIVTALILIAFNLFVLALLHMWTRKLDGRGLAAAGPPTMPTFSWPGPNGQRLDPPAGVENVEPTAS